MAKFVLSEAKNGYKFNLVATNGQVIATSQICNGNAYLIHIVIIIFEFFISKGNKGN